MNIKNFSELENLVRKKSTKPVVALICAHDMHSLEAVKEAVDANLISCIFVGVEEKITTIMESINFSKNNITIINCTDDTECAKIGVNLVKDNKATALMKGKIQTKDFLKAIVNSETGIKDS